MSIREGRPICTERGGAAKVHFGSQQWLAPLAEAGLQGIEI